MCCLLEGPDLSPNEKSGAITPRNTVVERPHDPGKRTGWPTASRAGLLRAADPDFPGLVMPALKAVIHCLRLRHPTRPLLECSRW